MKLSEFDFDLPPERIALRPAAPRDSARLLVVAENGAITDHRVSDLADLLRPGDAIVFNDTKVIHARLTGRRDREGTQISVEATLHKRVAPGVWTAFMRPGKRLRVGDRLRFVGSPASMADDLSATVLAKGDGGEVTLGFELDGAALDHAIARVGVMPLPPYIASRRPEDEQDQQDYQTIYARDPGSVAAPTAGLHFTQALLGRLATRGVSTHFVTLHVGAGTFLPVKTDNVADHRMHAEFGEVRADTAAALNDVRRRGGRIVCVGTTSLRLLESAGQEDGTIRAFADETAIFIKPGYQFRAADGLMTNFHLPKSTLFMLVCAFSGLAVMRRAYEHAVASDYRFYSYGDASLLWRAA